jgi:23S rRNA (adenine2503-C2)-methyltransferase
MNAPLKTRSTCLFPTGQRMSGPVPLAGLTRAQLRDVLIAHDLVDEKKAKMRAEQLWRWIYHYGVTDFDEMTNVSKALREAAARRSSRWPVPEITERQVSVDGTRKYLIQAWKAGSRWRPFSSPV